MKNNPILFGILLSVLAHALFTGFDTASKLVMMEYPYYEALAVEYFVAASVSFFYFKCTRSASIREDMRVHDWRRLLTVVFFRVCAQGVLFYAVTKVMLADFYVGIFTMPLMVALFSAWLLKERVNRTMEVVLLISFVGILIALRPGDHMNAWMLMVILGAVFIAGYAISLRYAVQTESTAAITIYMMLLAGAVMTIPTIINFKMPDFHALSLMVLAGLFFGIANILYATAIRHAPAPYVSGAQYLQLIFGSISGYLVFGDVPVIWTYVGGAIVIAANIYLMLSQRGKNADDPLT